MRPIDRDPPRRRAGRVARARRGRRAGAWLLAAALVAGLVAAPMPAWARSEKTLAYPRDQAWPAAVRFLAVDEHLKITDKDPDAGYVMFELRDEGKVFRGALEVVTVVRDGRTQITFVLQIADRPSWLEIAMLRRLEAKLRAELGSPSPPATPPPKKDEPRPDGPKDGPNDGPKDGGKDAGKDAPARDDGPPISSTP
jgi:hypothetical protein